MRSRCCWTTSRVRWTRPSANGSSPRATGTHWRCSSSLVRGASPSWREVSGSPSGLPVTGRIEDSYVRRLQRLPADTQLLVLAAAAEPAGDPILLHRAAEHLEIDMAAADAAADAGLLTIGGRAEFAHPLVRSCAIARRRLTIAIGYTRRSPRPSTPRPIRTDGLGIGRAPPRGPTRRSPPSSNGRPAGLRHAVASPLRRLPATLRSADHRPDAACRAPLAAEEGDRAAGSHAGAHRARSCPPALRRVASSGRSTGRRP